MTPGLRTRQRRCLEGSEPMLGLQKDQNSRASRSLQDNPQLRQKPNHTLLQERRDSTLKESDLPYIPPEDVEPVSDLEKRVRQWLKESSPPSARLLSNLQRQHKQYFDDTVYEQKNQRRTVLSTHDPPGSTNMVLFHPDFADWTSVQPNHDDWKTAKSESPDLHHILDDAASTLSKLLGAPFRRE